jgi:diguanylate cyclase (GGDEF)-like protein/PAS domain S-box-containing protein
MPQWSEIAQVIKASDEPYLFLGRHKSKDGREFPVEVRTSNMYRDGQHFFLSVARDITCRHVIDDELQQHRHSLWYALNVATDGIWEWNIKTNALYVSPKLKQMRGYGPEEEVGNVSFWVQGIHADDRERVMALMSEHLEGKLARYEAVYRLRNRAGHYIYVHDRGIVSERDREGHPLAAVGMVQNITDQVKLRERLENQAARDELTGAFNRRVCKEVVEQQIVASRISGSKFAVMFVDLDYFKRVNDEHGHHSGDKVLRSFVESVTQHLRDEDVLFRWGGEEFLVLLPGLDEEIVLKVAEKLRHYIESTPVILSEGQSISLTASVGVAVYPTHGSERGHLINKADIAMYRAKNNGRNRVELFS